VDKKEDVQEFEKLEQQLHSFLTEISELSKKKPNDALNKFKLKFINGALDRLNKLLGNDRPFPDFDLFDVDALPTNSDVVVILAQYSAAAHRFRANHTTKKDYNWWWVLNGKPSDFKTEDPEESNTNPNNNCVARAPPPANS
jgi:hypothetical protein